jgi:N6-L-threonylcarbamoyladenine synthase/protein kinase Bud32
MIAVLGARMHEAGDSVAIEDSRVVPKFRPDEVPVTWRQDEDVSVGDPRRTRSDAAGTDPEEVMGAEAAVALDPAGGRVTKRRAPKSYRHPTLDDRLRGDRTVLEARLTSLARREGVPTPVLYEVDAHEGTLVFEYVGDRDLRAVVGEDGDGDEALERVRTVGRYLARVHDAGFVHGDPTTRNVRVDDERTYLIDFGLGYHTEHVEDFAMDLHVFDGSLGGTADEPERLREAFESGYAEEGDHAVVEQLREIEDRGRYVDR